MTREQAATEAKRRWGKKAMIRANESVSSPERREAVKAEVVALKAKRDALEVEMREWLAAQPWYQDQTGASALIACWRYLKAHETPARRALYDAVNELWAWRAFNVVTGEL